MLGQWGKLSCVNLKVCTVGALVGRRGVEVISMHLCVGAACLGNNRGEVAGSAGHQ